MPQVYCKTYKYIYVNMLCSIVIYWPFEHGTVIPEDNIVNFVFNFQDNYVSICHFINCLMVNVSPLLTSWIIKYTAVAKFLLWYATHKLQRRYSASLKLKQLVIYCSGNFVLNIPKYTHIAVENHAAHFRNLLSCCGICKIVCWFIHYNQIRTIHDNVIKWKHFIAKYPEGLDSDRWIPLRGGAKIPRGLYPERVSRNTSSAGFTDLSPAPMGLSL